MVATAMICLSSATAAQAQNTPPTGGVDVKLQIDDLVESYTTSATTLGFLVRNIAFGYELSGAGRGTLSAQKFNLERETVDQAITVGKEPRGVIISKGAGDQPLLRFRIAGEKKDVVVQAKFIRSDWSMLTDGRAVTIIAPVDNLGVLDSLLPVIGKMMTPEVSKRLKDAPTSAIEDLTLRNSRTEGDQVIIQGNKMGFTISYPSVTATYSAEVKATP